MGYKNFLKKDFYKQHLIIHDLNIKSLSTGNPLLFGYLIYYRLKFYIETKLLEFKTLYKYGKLDFNKICWVNPQDIKYTIKTRKYWKWNKETRILGGDWDQKKILFEDLVAYQSIKQKFKEGKNWEETELYPIVPNEKEEGWIFINEEQRDIVIRKLEYLYKKIKKGGYQTQKNLISTKKWFKILKFRQKLDEIALAIDRDGQFLFINGRHRISIAKVLEIPPIPIVFLIRHKKWMDFRRELILFAKNSPSKKLTYPVNHPDLHDIPSKHGDLCFNMIKKNISISQGTLLDIGSNLGYFCHQFEEDGLDCNAMEENRESLYFLKKLKRVENKKFKIIPESIFEYRKNHELDFDIVLALNVFQKFLERKDTYLELVNLLKELKVKELYLGVYYHRKKNFYRNFSPEQFVNFIIENSCLNTAELIGKIEDGILIYKITSKS